MQVGLLDIIIFVTLFQAAFFAVFLLTVKRLDSMSNRLLAMLLVCVVLNISDYLLYRLNLIPSFPQFAFIGSNFALLTPVLLYLYVKSSCFNDFRLSHLDTLHLIPFLSFVAYWLFNYHFLDPEEMHHFLSSGALQSKMVTVILPILAYAIFLTYLLASIRILKNYGLGVKQMFSNIDDKSMSWLRNLLVSILAMALISMLFTVLSRVTGDYIQFEIILDVASITVFLFVNFLILKGLHQPTLFQGINQVGKYQASSLSNVQIEQYKDKLLSYMDQEKPYLTPSLSLKELASQLQITPRELSQIINESFHQHFFDFVNSYRVQVAKSLLIDTTGPKRSVLDVAYDSGFNSKSTFGETFKKMVGMTPTQYKKSH